MNNIDLKYGGVKGKGERSNHDFHLRLSKTEKERLVALAKSSNNATMSQFIKDQLFRPDVHYKLDLILKILMGEDKNEKNKTRLHR